MNDLDRTLIASECAGIILGRLMKVGIILAGVGGLVSMTANGMAEQAKEKTSIVSKKHVDKPVKHRHKVYIAKAETNPNFAPTGLIGPRD